MKRTVLVLFGAGLLPLALLGFILSAATWTAFNPGPVDEASATDNAIVYVGYLLQLPVVRNE